MSQVDTFPHHMEVSQPERKLYILRGLPGSGKSTLAKSLVKNGGWTFSTDDYFVHPETNEYRFDFRKLGAAHKWNQKRAREAMAQGLSPIVVDNTNVCAWEAQPYAACGVEHGYTIEIQQPTTPWARDAQELAKRNAHGVPLSAIQRMLSKWEDTDLSGILAARRGGGGGGKFHKAHKNKPRPQSKGVHKAQEPGGWQTISTERRTDGKSQSKYVPPGKRRAEAVTTPSQRKPVAQPKQPQQPLEEEKPLPRAFGVGAVVVAKSGVQTVKTELEARGWQRKASAGVRNVTPCPDPPSSDSECLAVHLSHAGASRSRETILDAMQTVLPEDTFCDVRLGLRVGDCDAFKETGPFYTMGSDEAEQPFTFSELFAGVGGFRMAVEATGNARCVFASELTTLCRRVYGDNFGAMPYPDVTAVPDSVFFGLRGHQLLTAGFPCQPWSVSGDREGLASATGALFWEIPRVLNHAQPLSFLLENVPYIQEHEHWELVLQALRDSGYSVAYRELSASHYTAQHRRRLFIVGFRDPAALQRFQWPQSPPEQRRFADIRDSAPDSALMLSAELWGKLQEAGLDPSRVIDESTEHLGVLRGTYKTAPMIQSQFVQEEGWDRPRFLSVAECMKAMGFADDFSFDSVDNPNTAYHMLGNAVVVPLVTALVSAVRNALGSDSP